MKNFLNIARFFILFTCFVCFSYYASCNEVKKLDIDLDLSSTYESPSIKDNLQGKLEKYDKNRNPKVLSRDEWLKFHNKRDPRGIEAKNVGNRAMADELKNISRYRATNLDPIGEDPDSFNSFGFKGKIDLN